MNILKGFFEYAALANNAAGVTAPFGELSSVALTASRTPRAYANASTAPNTVLRTFRTVDGSNAPIAIPPSVSNAMLNLGQWLFTQYANGAVPTDLQRDLFAQAIQTEFGFNTVTLGAISQGSSSNQRLPSSVSFIYHDTVGNQDYQINIWLSNASFMTGYTDSLIFCLPPTASLSDLRLSMVGLTNVLATQDTSALIADGIDNIKTVNGVVYPETTLVRKTFLWADLSNPTVTRNTTWVYVVYGPAGADDDAIKEATREYIAANSADGQWNLIYPGLYSENEFAIVPFWDNVAVDASGANYSLFSPLINTGKAKTTMTRLLPAGYPQAAAHPTTFVDTYLRIMPTSYRELSVGVIGNPNNAGGIIDIKSVYPDYTRIDTQSLDFQRMSADTQDFVRALLAALDVAYNANLTTTLPAEYTSVIRSNHQYICFDLNGYTFMVLVRSAFAP